MTGGRGASELIRVTTFDGITLAYETFGDRADPPVLLIQGLGAQMLGWHPDLCSALADSGCFVIRFDNRDVGASQRFPGSSYRVSDMARDTAGLIEALGFSSMHVVGQSMGGMIAQRLAVEHAAKVRSLCLIYTVPGIEHLVGRDVLVEREAAAVPSTRDEAADIYVRNEEACGSSGYSTDVAWLRELGGLMWDRGLDADGVQRQTHAIEAQPDLRDGLDGIDRPTLILHGDADRLLSHEGSEELARLINGAKLRIYAGMGHQLPRALWPDMVARIRDNMRTAA